MDYGNGSTSTSVSLKQAPLTSGSPVAGVSMFTPAAVRRSHGSQTPLLITATPGRRVGVDSSGTVMLTRRR